jgi:hypothetical protein
MRKHLFIDLGWTFLDTFALCWAFDKCSRELLALFAPLDRGRLAQLSLFAPLNLPHLAESALFAPISTRVNCEKDCALRFLGLYFGVRGLERTAIATLR